MTGSPAYRELGGFRSPKKARKPLSRRKASNLTISPAAPEFTPAEIEAFERESEASMRATFGAGDMRGLPGFHTVLRTIIERACQKHRETPEQAQIRAQAEAEVDDLLQGDRRANDPAFRGHLIQGRIAKLTTQPHL